MTLLDQLCRERGLSDKGLCALLGLPINAKEARKVHAWRMGETLPSPPVQSIIASKLGAHPDNLFPEREAA